MKKNKYIVEEVFKSKDAYMKKKRVEEMLINIIKKTETKYINNY